MVPVSGSAHTYAYGTPGELLAWIIGWDLIIEYAIGNVAVAISWANYFNTLLEGLGIHMPRWLTIDYTTAAAKMPQVVADAPHVLGVPIVFNVLAMAIVAAITVVLVWGIRESASFNFWMVAIKLVVLGFFIFVSFRYIKPEHWTPFAPNGFSGIASGAAIIFFSYIGFDAVSTVAEECRNPRRDMPIGIIGSLIICTVVYIVVALVFTGMIPFPALRDTLSSEQAEPLTLAMKFAAMPNWRSASWRSGPSSRTRRCCSFPPASRASSSRWRATACFRVREGPPASGPHVTTILTGVAWG